MDSRAATVRGQLQGLRISVATIRLFRRELAKHWRLLVGALLCSLAYSAARILEPWPLKFVFDNVLAEMPLHTPFPWLDEALGDDRMRILIAVTVAFMALAVVRTVAYYYDRVLTARVGQAVVLKIRQRLFAHLQRLSLGFHARSRTGELLTRLTSDINQLRELLVATLLSLFSETAILLGFTVAMFWMDWRLALVSLLVIPIIFVFTMLYAARIRAATRKQRRREGEVAARLQEALAGIHVVQLFAREDDEEERLRSLNKRSFRSGLAAVRFEARLDRAVELSVAAATAAALWFGATQVIAGRLTPGELIVFVVYLRGFYRPIRRISRIAQRAARASVCVERVTELLQRPPEVPDGSRVAPAFHGEIRLESVGFSYLPGIPVLRDVTLVVKPGQTVALVGPTGAGKSTLLGLIPRLYDPYDGVVRIDGHDVRDLTLRSLRNQISVVPQDGVLFGTDFRENISYGKPGATDDEIEAAAQAANIHEFIVSQPEGYASVIGERGVTLSGGQRQRLAIARAIVRNAQIVLLDEPAAGLDAESEALVMEALERLLEGRTALVVAHKLSTISRADLIVVVDEGRIVELGRHEALLAAGGRYRRLFDLQIAPRPGDQLPPRALEAL